MKKLFSLILFCMVLGMTSSCTSGKYAAVDSLRNLTYELEDNSYYYDYRDWDRAKNKYNRINDRISRYQYTPSERTEIGELQGKCMGYFAKGTVNSITDGITGVINQVKGAIKGAKDAWNNNNRGR